MAGLENLGMICYSNAVLHALGNSKEVHDNLVTHSDMHTIPGIYNNNNNIIITFIPIKLIYNGTRLVVLFTIMIGKGRSLKTVRFVCHGSGMP